MMTIEQGLPFKILMMTFSKAYSKCSCLEDPMFKEHYNLIMFQATQAPGVGTHIPHKPYHMA